MPSHAVTDFQPSGLVGSHFRILVTRTNRR
jgi:hypothetical protein